VVRAGHYHAGMTPKQRTEVQNLWRSGVVQVVVATIAVGGRASAPAAGAGFAAGAAYSAQSQPAAALAPAGHCGQHLCLRSRLCGLAVKA
jgi:hypothetical protein